MTDTDLLTGTIAAKLRLLPEVARVYPARFAPIAALRSAVGLVDAVAADPAVSMRTEHGITVAEASIGVAADGALLDAGLEAVRVIRATASDAGAAPLRVRVRIASIG